MRDFGPRCVGGWTLLKCHHPSFSIAPPRPIQPFPSEQARRVCPPPPSPDVLRVSSSQPLSGLSADGLVPIRARSSRLWINRHLAMGRNVPESRRDRVRALVARSTWHTHDTMTSPAWTPAEKALQWQGVVWNLNFFQKASRARRNRSGGGGVGSHKVLSLGYQKKYLGCTSMPDLTARL